MIAFTRIYICCVCRRRRIDFVSVQKYKFMQRRRRREGRRSVYVQRDGWRACLWYILKCLPHIRVKLIQTNVQLNGTAQSSSTLIKHIIDKFRSVLNCVNIYDHVGRFMWYVDWHFFFVYSLLSFNIFVKLVVKISLINMEKKVEAI